MAYIGLPRTIGLSSRNFTETQGSYNIQRLPLRRRVRTFARDTKPKPLRTPFDVQMRKAAPKQMTSSYSGVPRITYLGQQAVEETQALTPTSASLPSPLFSAKLKKPKTPRGGNTFGGSFT